MSRRFRICMAKGSRESLMPSYGRSKLTIISREKKIKKYLRRCSKKPVGDSFDFRANHPERMFEMYIKNSLERILLSGQNCDRPAFCYTALVLLATRVLPAPPNFGQAKHGEKDLLPPLSYTYSESWGQKDSVGAYPQKIPGENFRVWINLRKFSVFHEFACPYAIFLSACCGLNFDATNLPNS